MLGLGNSNAVHFYTCMHLWGLRGYLLQILLLGNQFWKKSEVAGGKRERERAEEPQKHGYIDGRSNSAKTMPNNGEAISLHA